MIPFLDLKAQYQQIGPELEAAVLEALRSCNYILGEPVAKFEANFADYCGTSSAVAVNTGTSALHMALLAAGIGPGDEVITTPTTFVATTAAIRYVGATPVFVDIDPVTWCIDPALIPAAITPKTKAIIPVHLHGRLADMAAIMKIARARNLLVIEDAAQAHGAERDGLRAGGFADIGCFSFYPGKNLGACGEGGAVVTNNPTYADNLRCLRDWGQRGRHNHVMEGHNARMDAIQGAVLGVKLKYLESWTDKRRAVANAYHAGLSPEIERAAGPFGRDHVGHVYAIRVANPTALSTELNNAGVPTNNHYPVPVHLQPIHADLGYGKGSFPIAERYAATTLSLPIHPDLSEADINFVVDAVNRLVDVPARMTA